MPVPFAEDAPLTEPAFFACELDIVLSHLSETGVWQAIEAELNRRTRRIDRLVPETVRLDATTISGKHLVSEEGLFQFGYSKDDPNLAQVKLMLASLDPLGMPVATQVVSGEQADDGLYIPAFEQSRATLAEKDVMWVGDCKMGAVATRSHIHHHQHYYLMPLARTGQVPEWLAQWLSQMRQVPPDLHQVKTQRYDGAEGASLSGYGMKRGVEGQITQVNRHELKIEQHQQTFGWRVYVSNAPEERLSFEQAVLTYIGMNGLSNRASIVSKVSL
ncbi:MAG: hypothetical protein HC769_29795 [Cyanobacteria bacterium CRU_2_1]|nr:hypothetical protein [Cyanobacteria bacterium CRU_2_1]